MLILGPGTIGLLAARFAAAEGAEVHLLGLNPVPEPLLSTPGGPSAPIRSWTAGTLPDLPWDAVVDCSNGAGMPARAVELVEPGVVSAPTWRAEGPHLDVYCGVGRKP